MITRKEVLEILALPQKSNQEHSIYYTKDIIKVIEYLTPPTAEEVCKALQEVYRKDMMDISYNKECNWFYYAEYSDMDKIVYIDDWGNLSMDKPYPPHLITLIGRFYEKEND